MLSFFMDQHVRIEITAGLRRRGIDVLTAYEDQSDRLDDDHLLDRAAVLGRVLVTQDKDLLAICGCRQARSQSFGGIVYAPRQDRAIGRTIEYLELIAHLVTMEEIQNRVEYVPHHE